MTSYSQGEVVLTEIAFSGEPGRKRRPRASLVLMTTTAAGSSSLLELSRAMSLRRFDAETCCWMTGSKLVL